MAALPVAGWMKGSMDSSSGVDVVRPRTEKRSLTCFRGLGRLWRLILLLVVIILFVPHTISIDRVSLPDNTSETVSLIAILWVLSHTVGSSMTGPFSKSVLSFPELVHLVWGGISLIASLYVFNLVRDFASSRDLRRLGIRLTAAALSLVLFQVGLFSYSLDAWGHGWVLPLPLMMAAGAAVLYFGHWKREAN